VAITVDYSTAPPWLITVPQSDLTLTTGTQYQLTVDEFWILLRDFTDNETTMAQPKLYSRIPATSSTPSITEIDLTYYRIQFEDGLYSVNIVNGNTNIREAEIKNQVSVNTNNTTGFIEPTFLEFGTFDGAVHIDVTNGLAGTDYPLGTPSSPVNNIPDAHAIAIARGLREFRIIEDLTISSDDFSAGFIFVGLSQLNTFVTLEAASNVNNCIFKNMRITGVLDNDNRLEECTIESITSFGGFIENCGLNIGVTLGGSSQTNLIDCYSNVAGTSTPYVDVGSGNALAIRGWKGGLELRNKTGPESVSFDLASGQVILDSTVTNGTLVIRGIGKLTNNATGTAVVVEELLDSRNLNKSVFLDGAVHFDSAASSTGTMFPWGTPGHPVNDLGDAITIANSNGLDKISFIGFATATGSHDFTNLEIFGGSGSSNVLNLAGAITNKGAFSRLIVYGQFNGLARITNCVLGTTGLGGVTDLEGRVVDCIINNSAGVIQDSTGAGTLFDNCAFTAPDDPQVTLNANGKGFNLRDCTGNILITNKTDVEADQCNIKGARVEIASSCTGGTITFTGLGTLTDNSTTTTVVDNLDTTKIIELHKLQGLDPANPMTVTQTTRDVDDISLVITGDGTTTSTVTRT
jgi:hypothetical protein